MSEKGLARSAVPQAGTKTKLRIKRAILCKHCDLSRIALLSPSCEGEGAI